MENILKKGKKVFLLVLLLSCAEDKLDTIRVNITQFPYNKPSALSLTFDDGCPSVFTRIAPLLEESNLRGTFFIISGMAEKKKEWDQWNALIERGHEVGNHSLTHSYYLGAITDESILRNEIDSSFALLEANLIKPPFSFAHPYHSSSPESDRIVFGHHFVSKISPPGFCHVIPLYDVLLCRNEIDEGIRNHSWIVTTAHGIDDCFAPITYSQLQGVIATVKSRNDKVFCDTFENLAKYKIELQNTRISAITDEQGGYALRLTNNLPPQFDYPLTVAVSGLNPDNYLVSPDEGKIVDTFTDDGTIYVTIEPTSSFFVKRK